ncbi:MAG: site-specific integrase [Treponema sp.]|jgi:integrase|nr:site-specific integrase [Treponema sp.]
MRKGLNIYKRKDGRYEGRYRIIDEASGESRYRSMYGRTFSELRERLIEIKGRLKQEHPHSGIPSLLTMRDVSNSWLESLSSSIKKSSFWNYKRKLDNHLMPEFGDCKYTDLSIERLEGFVLKKLLRGRLSDGSALSAGYVGDIVVMLKSIGKFAMKQYGFPNIMSLIVQPKVRKNDVVLLSRAETARLDYEIKNRLKEDSYKEYSIKLSVFLSLYTGIRLGELCALKWEDIDLGERIIHVRSSLQRIRRSDSQTETLLKKTSLTELVITTPKTESSNRDIPIPDALFPVLFSAYSSGFVLNGLLYPVEPRLLQYRFKSFLKSMQLPPIRFHALRHMFATNFLHQRSSDYKTLSEILGHSNVSTTMRKYVHSSDERKAECMKHFNF